jgi:hypothetical protein
MQLFKLALVAFCVLAIQTGVSSGQQTRLYLFTPTSPNVGLNLTTTTNLVTEGNGYCLLCPSYLIVHGWQSSKSSWMTEMKNELFKQNEKINVFIVDWGYGSDVSSNDFSNKFGYETSIKFMQNTTIREIWSYLGYYANNSWIIESRRYAGILDIHCIGHSLGGHVCGLTGKLAKASTGLKFARISALDPAGPCFDAYAKSNRLDKEDADYVSVIHTSGLLGFSSPLGHTDFYPDGGTRQPGCYPVSKESPPTKGITIVSLLLCDRNIDFGIETRSVMEISARNEMNTYALPNIFSVCSHSRAYEYFMESINSNKSSCEFVSTRCSSWKNYRRSRCSTCQQNRMGFHSQKVTNETVTYYLDVQKAAPHCVNKTFMSFNVSSSRYCSDAGPSKFNFSLVSFQFLFQAMFVNVALFVYSFVV